MNREIVEKFFSTAEEDIENKICPICKKPIGEFKDTLSKKEYTISGMCQECQDKTFG
jgi:hypothetical protein